MSRPVSGLAVRVMLGCLTAVGLATAMACDRCSGVSPCTTGEHVGVQGRIVDDATGRGVGGARIQLVRTGTDSASTFTSTDAEGNFQLDLKGETGSYDVVVAPPGLPPYRVQGLGLPSSTTPGEATVFQPWISVPSFGTAGELYFASNPSMLVPSGMFYFARTGGAQISGPGLSNGVYASNVISGRTVLLGGVNAASLDDVIGDVTVQLPDPYGTTVLHNFHIKPDYRFRSRGVLRFGVGPQLGWIMRIYNRATIAPVSGTTISFHRTGGIPTSAESFTAVTNSSGEFYVPILPLAKGTLIGDLTVQPPAPFNSYTTKGFQITTYDGDGNPFYMSLGVGPHLPWLGTVTCRGRPLQNTTVYVVRVGGIAADPQTFYSTSDANGNFPLYTFKPHAYGNLIVDLEFTPPAGSGCIGLVHHGLILPTLDFDTDGRFIASWDLPTS